jgi:hypothetical protein
VEEKPALRAVEPLVLDVRPIFAQVGSRCTTIDDAVASLTPGQAFVLLVPFEPALLFGKLEAEGFDAQIQTSARQELPDRVHARWTCGLGRGSRGRRWLRGWRGLS